MHFPRTFHPWALDHFVWAPRSATESRRADASRQGDCAGQDGGDADGASRDGSFGCHNAGANRGKALEAGSSRPNPSAPQRKWRAQAHQREAMFGMTSKGRRPNSPSIRNSGLELGTTRTDHPGPLGDEPGFRMAKTSGGGSALVGFAEWAEHRFPHESLEVKIRGPYRVGLGHDYPAASKNIFAHLRHWGLTVLSSLAKGACAQIGKMLYLCLMAPLAALWGGCYLGLRPGRRNSGQSEPQLHISKGGDPYLRTMMVQSAHHILGPFGADSDLRRWGLRLAERGGKNAKKRAVVAVARKLAILLHRLWVSGEVYEPLRNRRQATLPAAA